MKLDNNPRFKLLRVQMPRIAEKLQLFWGCPEFGPYVSHLMKDTRDGTRAGFPLEIANALFGLVEDHDYLFPHFSDSHGDVGGYRSQAADDARRAAPKFEEVADQIRKGKAAIPDKVATEDPKVALRRKDGASSEKAVDDASILCVALMGFGDLGATTPAADMLKLAHEILFSRFERLIAEQGLQKVKTVGDLFVVSGGTSRHQPDHLERCARLALAMRKAVEEVNAAHQTEIDMRAGLDVGPVKMGDVGMIRPVHDIWGETVSLATGLESSAPPGTIRLSQAARDRLASEFDVIADRRVDVPMSGLMQVYQLEGNNKPRRTWWGAK